MTKGKCATFCDVLFKDFNDLSEELCIRVTLTTETQHYTSGDNTRKPWSLIGVIQFLQASDQALI